MDKEKFKVIIAHIENGRKTFYHQAFKDKLFIAQTLLEAGWVEQIINNSFIKNIVNLLAPFVQNKKIKEAIRLLQEGLKDEETAHIKKVKGKP